jgi:3'-phosphoadenosine 5'-phosphosulfate sulfotransferase (PAPS reductase)/FAD synthetase
MLDLDHDGLFAAYERIAPMPPVKPRPPEAGLNGLLLVDSAQVRVNEADLILEAAVVSQRPSHVFLLFSGGHDSLAATHLSSMLLQNTLRRYPADFSYGLRVVVLHINTGIGIPQTREYVRLVTWNHRWSYQEYRTPVSYEENVLAYGFPGPGQHTAMYTLLKERALRMAVRNLTPPHPLEVHRGEINDLLNDLQGFPLRWQYGLVTTLRRYLTKAISAYRQDLRPMAFVTGVRRQESQRRMGNVIPMQKHGRHWWLSPLTEWTKDDVLDYMEAGRLPHNLVVDCLHKSGECLCGRTL